MPREATSAAEIGRMLRGHKYGRYWKAKCPAHSDQDPSLAIWTDPEDGHTGFYCYAGCAWRDVAHQLKAMGATIGKKKDQMPAELRQVRPDDPDDLRRIEYAKTLWKEGVPARGTRVEFYLKQRGLSLPPELDGPLVRYHPACPPMPRRPAMLVGMWPPDGQWLTGLSRCFIDLDGHRLGDKMMLGRAGVAMLDAAGPQLHLCEGFETGLALYLDGKRPVWACMSAGKMDRLPLLDGVEHLIIHRDHDKTGEQAAHRLAMRWIEAGRKADIFKVPQAGWDYADLVEKRHAR